jgi:hypothetical protein
MWLTSTSLGSESGFTAKLWFCEEISTRPGRPAHGVVPAVVAKLELERLAAERLTEDLVAHADAKHGHLA